MNATLCQKRLFRAATAAGYPLCSEWDAAVSGILIGTGQGDLREWNPQDNNADAFELMARLGISVQQDYAAQVLRAWQPGGLIAEVSTKSGRPKAIRMAIVFAAANS